MKRLTEKRLRIIKTILLYLDVIVSGMCMAMTGPTLLDLQHIINTDLKHVGFIYTARSTGYLMGSLLGGIGFDMTNKKQFLFMVLTFLISVSSFAQPWSRCIEVLTAWMVINGFCLGALDTGANVLCLNLWGKDSGPFFQALHFTYGIGGLVAPLIAAPFLGDFRSEENASSSNHSSIFQNDLQNTSTSTVNPYFLDNSSSITNVTSYAKSTVASSSGIPTITYAYTIVGCLAIPVAILFLVTSIVAPIDDNKHSNKSEKASSSNKMFIVIIVFLNFLLLFIETGTEIGYAQMVTTYAVKGPLKLTKTTGSYLTSTFWGAFTLSRFMAVFLTLKFSNIVLIVKDLVITSVGAIVLLCLAETQEWSVWLGSVLLGVGIASFFPTAVAWVEEYITVTNKIVSLFTVGAAFGEMVIPYTISHYIDDVPQVLVYVVTASCVLCVLVVFFMYLILRKKETKYKSGAGVTNEACDQIEKY